MPSPFPHTHVRVRDLSELTAGLPGLFGFPPVNSLVLLVFRGQHDLSVSVAMRVNLPEPGHVPSVAHHLLRAAKVNDAVAAVAVVVGGGPDPTAQRPFVDALRNTLAEEDIVLVHASWVARLGHAEPWWCYDDPLCGGHVPDPQTSTLAAAMAVTGTATFPNRSALAKRLAPDLTHLPIRKKLLQESKVADATTPYGPRRLAKDLTLVHTMIHRAATTTSLPELTDDEAVRLGRALAHMPVRDECMAYGLSLHAEAAERLWTVLVRGLPAPERAEPAALLAMSAYLRGDGVLAALAVETARKANKTHQTATLLEQALQRGASPRTIRDLLIRAMKEGKEKYSDHTEDVPALPTTPLPTGMENHTVNLTAFRTPDEPSLAAPEQPEPTVPHTPEPPSPSDPPWETDTPTTQQVADPTTEASPQPVPPLDSWRKAESPMSLVPTATNVPESSRSVRQEPDALISRDRGETPRQIADQVTLVPTASAFLLPCESAGVESSPRDETPTAAVPHGRSARSETLGAAVPMPTAGGLLNTGQPIGAEPRRVRPSALVSPDLDEAPVPPGLVLAANDMAASDRRVSYLRPSSRGPRTLVPHDYSPTPQAVAMDLMHALLAANTCRPTAPSVPG